MFIFGVVVTKLKALRGWRGWCDIRFVLNIDIELGKHQDHDGG